MSPIMIFSALFNDLYLSSSYTAYFLYWNLWYRRIISQKLRFTPFHLLYRKDVSLWNFLPRSYSYFNCWCSICSLYSQDRQTESVWSSWSWLQRWFYPCWSVSPLIQKSNCYILYWLQYCLSHRYPCITTRQHWYTLHGISLYRSWECLSEHWSLNYVIWFEFDFIDAVFIDWYNTYHRQNTVISDLYLQMCLIRQFGFLHASVILFNLYRSILFDSSNSLL